MNIVGIDAGYLGLAATMILYGSWNESKGYDKTHRRERLVFNKD